MVDNISGHQLRLNAETLYQFQQALTKDNKDFVTEFVNSSTIKDDEKRCKAEAAIRDFLKVGDGKIDLADQITFLTLADKLDGGDKAYNGLMDQKGIDKLVKMAADGKLVQKESQQFDLFHGRISQSEFIQEKAKNAFCPPAPPPAERLRQVDESEVVDFGKTPQKAKFDENITVISGNGNTEIQCNLPTKLGNLNDTNYDPAEKTRRITQKSDNSLVYTYQEGVKTVSKTVDFKNTGKATFSDGTVFSKNPDGTTRVELGGSSYTFQLKNGNVEIADEEAGGKTRRYGKDGQVFAVDNDGAATLVADSWSQEKEIIPPNVRKRQATATGKPGKFDDMISVKNINGDTVLDYGDTKITQTADQSFIYQYRDINRRKHKETVTFNAEGVHEFPDGTKFTRSPDTASTVTVDLKTAGQQDSSYHVRFERRNVQITNPQDPAGSKMFAVDGKIYTKTDTGAWVETPKATWGIVETEPQQAKQPTQLEPYVAKHGVDAGYVEKVKNNAWIKDVQKAMKIVDDGQGSKSIRYTVKKQDWLSDIVPALFWKFQGANPAYNNANLASSQPMYDDLMDLVKQATNTSDPTKLKVTGKPFDIEMKMIEVLMKKYFENQEETTKK